MSDLNSLSADKTIAALESAGRIEEIDSALIQMVRSLAAAVDSDPQNAPLWGRYQVALELLRELDAGDLDEFQALLDEMQATVGNEADS